MVDRNLDDKFSVQAKDRISYQLLVFKGSFTVKNLVPVRNVVTELMERSENKIVMDLENCTEMDSSSIGLVANLLKKLESAGGRLAILNPQEKIREILDETRLSTVVPFFSSLEEVDVEFDI